MINTAGSGHVRQPRLSPAVTHHMLHFAEAFQLSYDQFVWNFWRKPVHFDADLALVWVYDQATFPFHGYFRPGPSVSMSFSEEKVTIQTWLY